MSLPPDGSFPPSDGSSSMQHPQITQMQQQQFHPGMQSMMQQQQQQQYMMDPPSSLPSTAYMPPPHSSLPSTSSPITPGSSLLSPSSFAPPGPSTSSAAPLKRRRFSGAKIQPTRIKKVMQADEEIGRMVASVPVAIGRAMEHFAEKFLLSASSAVTGSGARTLAPHHLKMAMLSNPHFAFLEPILREVGLPVRAGDAYQFPQQATVQSMQHMQQQAMQSAAPPMQQMQQGGMALPPYMDVPSMIPSGVPQMMGAAEMNQFAMHNPYFMQQMQPQSYDPLAAMGQMGQMISAGASVPYQAGTLSSPVVSSPITSPTGVAPVAPGGRTARRSSSAVSNGEGGEAGGKKPRGRPRKNKKDKCVEDDLEVDSSMANNGLLRPPSPGDIKAESNEADRLLMPPPPLLPMKPPPS